MGISHDLLFTSLDNFAKRSSASTSRGSQKQALAIASAFFNEAHLRCMKNEAGLRPVKRAFGTRRRKSALRFMRASRAHRGNEVAASYLRSKCFIDNFALLC